MRHAGLRAWRDPSPGGPADCEGHLQVTSTGRDPWLVVIDMQRIFGDPTSQWATPGYASIEPTVARLARAFGSRVIFLGPE